MNYRITSLVIVAVACCGLFACGRVLSESDLRSHFIENASPNWLFVPGGHITFDAHEAHLIRQWLTTHCSGWKSASLEDFSPAKTQLLTAKCGIEIDTDRIVITFERDQKDLDSTIYLQRALSLAEQDFWRRIISGINAPNQAAEPTRTSGTPPADAGDRASGARGSL